MSDLDDLITMQLDYLEASADALDEVDIAMTAIADEFLALTASATQRVERGELSVMEYRTRKAAKEAGDTAEELRDKVEAVQAQREANRWREVRAQLYEIIDEQMAELLEG